MLHVPCSMLVNKQTVSFTTSDQVTIKADYYKSDLPVGHTILALHMMPADRSSWQTFAEQATQAGYNLLAIDLRGHGESTTQGDQVLDFQQFTDEQHQQSILDVEAAVDYLAQQSVDTQRLTLMGASIGANLALEFLQTHQEIATGVLISPGLNYRGIEADKLAAGLSGSQSILLISGQQDEYPHNSLLQLKTIIPGNSETIVLPSASHGTNLFNDHPKLIIRILSWLNEELTL